MQEVLTYIFSPKDVQIKALGQGNGVWGLMLKKWHIVNAAKYATSANTKKFPQ